MNVTSNKKSENTEEARDVFGNSAGIVDFYRYAYTKSLKRNVDTSCERAIESGEALQKNLESVLKDLQEFTYNVSIQERNDVLEKLGGDPFDELRRYANVVAVLVKTLKCYKIDITSFDNL